MNGIGIDYQQTLTLIALREGGQERPRTRMIDDGCRQLIPHAVADNGLWGTKAFQAQPARWLSPVEGLPTGPWLDEASSGPFWDCLYRRTYNYLGRIPPVPREGYQVVVALPSASDSDEATVVLRRSEKAGFLHGQSITVTDALLSRWLATPGNAQLPPQVAVVIAITDCAVCVSGYRSDGLRSDGWPRFVRGGWLRLESVGFRYWCDHLLEEVRRHLTESPGASEELLLRDGAVEFASRLRMMKRTEALEWTGPLHDRLFSPASFSPGECHNWPSATSLAVKLPAAVKRVIQPLGATSKVSLLILGGVGAVWPFAAEIAKNLGPTWCGSSPEHDIALGAAWWPILGRRCLADSPYLVLESTRLAAHSTLALEPAASEPEQSTDDSGSEMNSIPPWERDRK